MSNEIATIQNKSIINSFSIEQAKTMREQFDDHIKSMLALLKEGEDYGLVKDKNGNNVFDKPCLFKSGAEVLCIAMGFDVKYTYQKDLDIANNYLSYLVIAELYKDERYIGKGSGICSNHWKSYMKKDPLPHEHTIMKIAEKRSLVSAIINTTHISSVVTQDAEDIEDKEFFTNNQYNKANQTRVKLIDEANKLSIELGYKHINDCVIELSKSKYQRIEDVQTNNLPKFIEVLKQSLENKKSNDLSTELDQPLQPSSENLNEDIKLIKINELKSLCEKAKMNMDISGSWTLEQIEQSLIEVKSYLETLNHEEN